MMDGNFSQAYLNSLGSGFANVFGSAASAPCATANSCRSVAGGNKVLQIPGGMIPASMLDPNSQALYKLMPQPNANRSRKAVITFRT
jgi:hypothetical protein